MKYYRHNHPRFQTKETTPEDYERVLSAMEVDGCSKLTIQKVMKCGSQRATKIMDSLTRRGKVEPYGRGHRLVG